MSIMSLSRIKYLRETLEEENIDLSEISEIDEAYNRMLLFDDKMREDPDNATAWDKLNDLEEFVSPLERDIYNWVEENYGESEAMDPSWDIGALANHLERK